MTPPSADVETQGQVSPVPGAALLHITYFTDPLCSWSWAFEPQWRRLRVECGDQLTWRYHMAGMISDWQQYSDPLNDVNRPVQMGPQWYQVRTLSGMPLEERLWYEDPPASSFPGCIAVKAAERQGPVAGERYLRLLREAVMLRRRNIARREIRVAIAEELAALLPGFDAGRFAADLDNPAVLQAFREDIKEVRYRNIGRFPTLFLQPRTGPAIMLVGYRPYEALRTALTTLVPALVFMPATGDAIEYLQTWRSATVQEIAEMYGMERGAATAALEAAVTAGGAERQGELYVAA